MLLPEKHNVIFQIDPGVVGDEHSTKELVSLILIFSEPLLCLWNFFYLRSCILKIFLLFPATFPPPTPPLYGSRTFTDLEENSSMAKLPYLLYVKK